MSIAPKPGTRLYSAADSTEFVVVRGSAEAVDLRIGGHPAVLNPADRQEGLEVLTPPDAAPSPGKRYVAQAGAIELLCVKAGGAGAAIGEEPFAPKDAKPLPASD